MRKLILFLIILLSFSGCSSRGVEYYDFPALSWHSENRTLNLDSTNSYRMTVDATAVNIKIEAKGSGFFYEKIGSEWSDIQYSAIYDKSGKYELLFKSLFLTQSIQITYSWSARYPKIDKSYIDTGEEVKPLQLNGATWFLKIPNYKKDKSYLLAVYYRYDPNLSSALEQSKVYATSKVIDTTTDLVVDTSNIITYQVPKDCDMVYSIALTSDYNAFKYVDKVTIYEKDLPNDWTSLFLIYGIIGALSIILYNFLKFRRKKHGNKHNRDKQKA